jgi:Leucine-rich repeat (LRR) protein
MCSCNRKLDTLLVTSYKKFEFIASAFRKESELNKISTIHDETFVRLERLKYLNLSNNSVRNISLAVFHSMLRQTEMYTSEVTSFSKLNVFSLSNNAI